MLNPLMAITLAMMCGLALFAVLSVPPIGPLAAIVLMPLLIAGYMRVCRALEEEEAIEPGQLLEGFRKQGGRLAALGGFGIMGLFGASAVMVSTGGKALAAVLEKFHSANPQVLLDAMWSAGPDVSFSLMLGFALLCILMLALQYAPMLVLFNAVTPLAAMRASLYGSLRNLIPYTVYTLIMQMIALVLGFLPFNIGLVVLLPLGLTSLYVSYRNIFPFAHELAALEPVSHNPEA